MLLLETTRGCVFKCKFCYYPKSYDKQYYLSRGAVLATSPLHQRGAEEMLLLDPAFQTGRRTSRQFVRTLAEGNPGRRFKYFGELRAGGSHRRSPGFSATPALRKSRSGFSRSNPKRWIDGSQEQPEEGVREGCAGGAMDARIKVTVDLIVGLPGDTQESVRRENCGICAMAGCIRAPGCSDAAMPARNRVPAQKPPNSASPTNRIPPYYVLRTPRSTAAPPFSD